VTVFAPTSLVWARPRYELLLLTLVAAVALLPVYGPGDQDLSRFCLTQALVHGHLSNDRCLTPSFDKALYGGHLYSDKAPGLSLFAVPAVEGVQLRPVEQIDGPDARLWGVRVLTSGIALLLGAFLVGRVVEGLVPGRGAAALVAYALGTIVAPLAATGFAHVAAATLGFAAFVLAWRRRPLLAGLVGGAALLVEYQTAAILAALGAYVVLLGLRAAAAYVAGLIPGVALLLTYNALAFGSPWHFSYRYVALEQQSTGFFGIGLPRLHATWEVFGGSSGLVLVSPVLLAAAYGLWLLARTRPVEAAVCAAVTVFFLLLACGYYVPYGGTELGPRFVVPALPFLALGLGSAFARIPRLTAALAILSVLAVFGLTLIWSSNPPIHGTIWGELARVPSEGRASGLMRHMTDNVFGWSSAGSGWGLAVMVAAAVAALALGLPRRGWDVRQHPWRAGGAVAIGLALAVGALHVATKPIELHTSIVGTASAAFPGDEVDFTVGIVNRTSEYLPHAVLMIRLPPGMRLLGRPTHERGRGCTGSSTLACDLDFLEGHMATKVQLGVRIEPNAASTLAVSAWGLAGDVAGPKSSFTVVTGSG
jgi:hypothetical protein